MTSSDDEDLKRAIALSLEADSTPPQSSRNTTSLLGLDRKAQEQERLARVTANKRKASISPPPLYRDTADVGVKRPRLEEPRNTVNAGYYSDLQPKDRLRANNIATAKSIACAESLGSTAAPPTGLQYPSGTVKRTWAFGYERKNDVKIEEVFQKADLKTAVLSAFQWDVEWVLSKIDARTTKLVFAMQAKDKATQDQYLQETAGMPNLRLCFPPMPGQVHCMHSKLMLLFHPGYLRVVVPSANLVNYDWGETGVMENSVFLVDLPRREDRKQYSKEQLTPFGEELIYFLEKMGLQEDVRIGILNFDFSKTQHLAFVHTVGGSHTHEDLKRTGHPGLSRAIRFLDLNNSSNLQVDFVASSLGSLNEAFLQTIYQAACGAEDTLSAPAAGQLDLESSFRIYFPTHETVANSNGGIEVSALYHPEIGHFQAVSIAECIQSSFNTYSSSTTLTLCTLNIQELLTRN